MLLLKSYNKYMYKCMYVFFPWLKTNVTLLCAVSNIQSWWYWKLNRELFLYLKSPVVEEKWKNILKKQMPSIMYTSCLRDGVEVGAICSISMQKLWKGRNSLGNAQSNPSEQKERATCCKQWYINKTLS